MPSKESAAKDHDMVSKAQRALVTVQTFSYAAIYVLSGTSQPLLVALLTQAGLADPTCQLFMVFYYVMPALWLLPVLLFNGEPQWPHRYTIYKGAGAAMWEIAAQSLNYTGASMAGPTIFAIIYSSVTIWTVIFSQIFLGRRINGLQWVSVLVVFIGLTVTAADSSNMGDNVLRGSILVIVGSAMHGFTYVLYEALMTVGEEKLTVKQNNFIQGSVAGGLYLVWQLFYTLPRFDELIRIPMQKSGTNIWYALILLGAFGMANAVHSFVYFHTLLHFPGGATSAGVMKGLQAVLVFIFTHFLYCGKLGGSEMCFSNTKLVSFITVCGGVFGYGYTTTRVPSATVEKKTENSVGTAIEIEHVHETSKLISASP